MARTLRSAAEAAARHQQFPLRLLRYTDRIHRYIGRRTWRVTMLDAMGFDHLDGAYMDGLGQVVVEVVVGALQLIQLVKFGL